MNFGINFPYGSPMSIAASRRSRLAAAKRIGVTLLRTDLPWFVVEPTDGTWSWTVADAIVSDILAYGMTPLLVLHQPEAWASAGSVRGSSYPPASNARFAAYCAAVAGRYGPQGVHNYEVWNEPNIKLFWNPTVSAADYYTMFAAAATAIRAADASAFVMNGGLASTTTTANNTNFVAYLGALFTASGGAWAGDALALHEYNWPRAPDHVGNSNYWYQTDTTSPSILSVLAANGQTNLPIWVTEMGAPTYGSLWQAQSNTLLGDSGSCTETYQASIATKAVARAKTIANISSVFWFNDADDSAAAASDMHGWFGLCRNDGTFKPAALVFKAAIT